MKVIVAIDSWKGCMDSLEAGRAVEAGIGRAEPRAQVWVRPLADGGEGTVDALIEAQKGVKHSLLVTGPLGEPVECAYGIIEESKTAVLEMAGAAGLTLVPPSKRNPLHTTTRGVGEVIRDAIEKGCRRFVIGIGGSATNDGGAGMLQALGYDFLDKNGRQISSGAKGLADLHEIRRDSVPKELALCQFRIACDVTNVLCGKQGASAVFGPQKGATEAMVEDMDRWLAHYAQLAKAICPTADPLQPGTGAAGGLGFAFCAFLGARLESGIGIVLEETQLESYICKADLVITGEGRLDGQTAMGKAPAGVAAMAKKYGKPVIAFAGSVAPEAVACHEAGIDAFFPVLRNPATLEEAMETNRAKTNLAAAAEEAFRLWNIGKSAQ